MKQYKNRNEVEEKYKWDLSEYYKSDDEFFEAYSKLNKELDILKSYVGCTTDSFKLYEYLNKETELEAEVEKNYIYAVVRNDEVLGQSIPLDMLNKANLLMTKLSNLTAFFNPELLKLSKDKYEKLFSNNDKLLIYKPYLDNMYRYKEHVLTEEEEKIATLIVSATNDFRTISSNLLNSEHDYGKIEIEDGKRVELTTTNSRFLKTSRNRKIRKEADTKLLKKASSYATTSASLLNNYVKLEDALASIYHFDNSLDAKLFSNELNVKIYDVLSSTVRKHVDSLQRYYNVKKKILCLDELYTYDLLTKLTTYDKEYSIEEAQKMIREALKPLGEDYLTKYDKIINNRYIDYCQYKGKCSGGYSISGHKTNSRILMSYNYDFESISTIAHETGHNINDQYLIENNFLPYRENAIINAEVTSLINECLLANYMIKNGKTKEEKIMGLDSIIGVIESNLFGSVREGDMERLMHENVHNGNCLTKEFMCKITKDSLKYYYGDKVKLTKYSPYKWIYRSHYYSKFYLYSYAICVSVASSLAKDILSGNKETLDKYLKYIKTGSNVTPLDAFKILGVDLEKEDVYLDAIKYFDSLVDELEELTK